jgi:iron complex outermembrane receptor protein
MKGRPHRFIILLAKRSLPFSSLAIVSVLLLGLPSRLIAQERPLTAVAMKKLSLEELMNIEVTSVSKKAEKLSGAASAVQVITSEDIRSSGAKTLPEALRLAPNLQVAQVNSSQWAISARGFNNVLANKLLVMIDGRSVYTPMYAGVFWDVQNILLEDVDRIEVISGPGGTLWGANAVNGVINIITKSAKDTKGLFVEAATGTNMPASGSLRYGGQVNNDLAYRVYGTGFKMGNTLESNGSKSNDNWPMVQGGFQLDWTPSSKDQITLQQNIYSGRPNPDAVPLSVVARGDNIGIRWSRKSSDKYNFQLQGYYDHTWRDFKNGLKEDLKTYDLDWNNQYQLAQRHMLSFGSGIRLMDHNMTNLELFGFLPAQKSLYLFNVYLQDEITLVEDKLRLTVGSKVEHNSYTGFEFQPNARLAWTPKKDQTIWAAVSRAVRTPARIDRDFSVSLTPEIPLIAANDDFVSETVLAYELGWRLQPADNTSISLATFYNTYDNIRTVEPLSSAAYPVVFGNGVKGNAYGVELSATYQPRNWWRLRGGYTFMKKDLSLKPGSRDTNQGTAESNDPANQFLVQSTVNFARNFEFGTVFRYVDNLTKPYVPHYFGLDLRLGWHVSKSLELNVVGQNLLDRQHAEFIPDSPSPRLIQRSLYGKLTWRY